MAPEPLALAGTTGLNETLTIGPHGGTLYNAETTQGFITASGMVLTGSGPVTFLSSPTANEAQLQQQPVVHRRFEAEL